MKRISSILIGITFILFACHKDENEPDTNNCIFYQQAPAKYVNIPATGHVNQNVPLKIYFSCFNGCGEFGSIEKSDEGNTKIFIIIAKYEGCICSQDCPTRQTIYNFKTTLPGTYFLKFLIYDNNYIVDTLVIY